MKNEVFAGDLSQVDGAAPGQRVIRRQGQHIVVGGEKVKLELFVLVRRRHHDKRQFDFFGGQLFQQLIGAGLDDFKVDPRMLPIKRSQHVGVVDPSERGDHTHAQGAFQQAPVTLDALFGVLQIAQQDFGVVDKIAAGLGQTDGAGSAFKQLDAQFFLQLGDLVGQRGLADIDPVGCPGEVLLLGQFDHILQLVQFHGKGLP